jgi:hypothetical protein
MTTSSLGHLFIPMRAGNPPHPKPLPKSIIPRKIDRGEGVWVPHPDPLLRLIILRKVDRGEGAGRNDSPDT